MKILKLNCNKCGHKIQIASTIKYFNCLSCESSLILIEKDQIVYTKVVENSTDEKISVIVEENKSKKLDQTLKLKALSIESKIAKLDRDWKEDEEKNHKYLQGYSYEVPQEFSIGEDFFAIFICIILCTLIYFANPYPLNIIFSVLTFVIGGILSVTNNTRLKKYSAAKQKYLEKRSVLLKRLKKIES